MMCSFASARAPSAFAALHSSTRLAAQSAQTNPRHFHSLWSAYASLEDTSPRCTRAGLYAINPAGQIVGNRASAHSTWEGCMVVAQHQDQVKAMDELINKNTVRIILMLAALVIAALALLRVADWLISIS